MKIRKSVSPVKMKKEIIVIISSLLALILVVFLLILPGIEAMNLSRSGFLFEENRLKNTETQIQKLSALDKKYKDNPKEIEKIILALPKEAELAGLLINLENLAAANGLIMESIDFKTIEKKSSAKPSQTGEEALDLTTGKNQELPGSLAPASRPSAQSYKTTAIVLSLEGGYNNFKSYLNAIEGNPRLMDITSLNYSSKSSQNLDFFNFGLNLNVYYQ